ncbi:MAG TPA: hypothetical protein VJT67_07255 [Longimicrobiaceae bacterium]|nr:hypothetical protein [Longimicrobiaceae bacterium]
MKAGAAFGNYLKAADLGGRRVTVTFEEITLEEMKGEGGKKLVVSFVGKDKKLILNRTNADTITDILGTDETEDWIGKSIVLFPSKTSYQGKRVDCIRVDAVRRAAAPQQRQAPPPPPVDEEPEGETEFQVSDDDVPF